MYLMDAIVESHTLCSMNDYMRNLRMALQEDALDTKDVEVVFLGFLAHSSLHKFLISIDYTGLMCYAE